MFDHEYMPVLIVPGKDRMLLKDIENVRVQSTTKAEWLRLSVQEKTMLRQYLTDSPDKKSWKPPLAACRIGFNDKGVFVHEEHKKRYFGLLESAARHLVPAVATQEAIPRYYRGSHAGGEMMEHLASKVQTITDDMRKQVLQSTFRAADTNGNGTLSRHEIGSLMRRLACTVTSQEIDQLMLEADVNRDDQIDYEEFANWMMITKRGLISEKVATELGTAADVVRASFRVWDLDGNGQISKGEVRKILREACKLSGKDVEVLADVMDTDDDGRIDYDEFVGFLFPSALMT